MVDLLSPPPGQGATRPSPAPAQDGVAVSHGPLPLLGRTALVTGVSRRIGIGHAVARRLAAWGASVFVHHYCPHDEERPWGADPGGAGAVVAEVRQALGDPGATVHDLSLDLAGATAPEQLVEAAVGAFGHLDVLVANHASSGRDGPLGSLDAAVLDAHWAVNTRSVILLVQAFAAAHDGRPGGRVVLMTSGQNLGPMIGEIAYATSKGALVSITPSLAEAVADRGITVNTVNPGPVDTGYAPPDVHEAVRRRFPAGRWGAPDDAARLVAWLTTDDAAWVTGQVINSEGGFRRWG